MKVVLKEGWIALDMVYSTGRESWGFYKDKPEYIEDVYLSDGTCRPGELIRIMYVEADEASAEK